MTKTLTEKDKELRLIRREIKEWAREIRKGNFAAKFPDKLFYKIKTTEDIDSFRVFIEGSCQLSQRLDGLWEKRCY